MLRMKKNWMAFIDIMGMSDKISSSKEPRDFLMYNTILYMIKDRD